MIYFVTGPSHDDNATEALSLAIQGRKNVLAFKHSSSIEPDSISTSMGINISTNVIKNPLEILPRAQKYDPDECVILLDEAECFPATIIDICVELSYSGYEIYVAGIMKNWRCVPNITCTEMASISDEMFKLRAYCTFCEDGYASKSIEVEEDEYSESRPACNACYKEIMDKFNINYIGKHPRYMETKLPKATN